MPFKNIIEKGSLKVELSITNFKTFCKFSSCKSLTLVLIPVFISLKGFNKEQIIRWHTDFLLKCPLGLVSSDQFKAYYSLLLPADLTASSKNEILDKLFDLFDIDADGSLNFTEFLVSFWIRCKAPIREKYTWIFNMLDSDRNGRLNYTEIRNALTFCLNVDDLDDLLEALNRDKATTKTVQGISECCEAVVSEDEDLFEDTVMSGSFVNNVSYKRKYNLYSKTTRLIEDKIDKTVLLLHGK